MTAVWPVTLPPCPIAEHEETIESPKVTFEPEVGPPIDRLRASVWTSQFPATFKMTSVQVTTFETFVRGTIRGGTLPFTIKHPRTRADATVKMVGDQLYTVRRHAAMLWLVSFNLMVLP